MTRLRFYATTTLTMAVLAVIAFGIQPSLLARFTLPGLTDSASHPPPTSGTYAFATYPGPALGQTFVDPVFGSTIRRITSDHASDDLYARNMFWNADATKYLHYGRVTDTTTGAVTHTVPLGSYSFDAGFDPVNPNVYYYISGSTIHRVVLGTGGAKTDAVWLTVPATINSQGGSENWISADGQVIAVSYGAEPSVHVFDTSNLAAGPFAGAVPKGSSTGYSAMLPSGRYVVTTSGTGYQNNSSNTTFRSYAINLAARTVSTAGNAFWNLCGDHGAFISPSDGKDYLITTSCYNIDNLMRVDVTGTAGTETAQLSANKTLFANLSWSFMDHLTAVAKGPMRDWAFMDTEIGSTGSWAPYQSEIIAFNVITGETRRLAHHRSNVDGCGGYFNQPRVSASWNGELVGWASDFQQGCSDIFVLPFGGATSSSGDTTPPTVSITSPGAGTFSGTLTISATAADAVGVVGVQLKANGSSIAAEMTGAPYSMVWNSTSVTNGVYNITAVARDAAGNSTTSAPVVITVANPPAPPPPPVDTVWPVVSLTSPASGASVSALVSVNATASDDVGVVGVQFLVDGAKLGSEDLTAPYQAVWNSAFSTNGTHTVAAAARDAAGHVTTSTAVTVTVNNAVLNVLPLGSIFGDDTIFGDSRSLSSGSGIEMSAGSASLLREFGASDGASTMTWRVNGTTASVVLNGTVVWTGTTTSTTLLRVQWTGTALQAIRSTTVRQSVPSSGPVHVLASGTLFPSLVIK